MNSSQPYRDPKAEEIVTNTEPKIGIVTVTFNSESVLGDFFASIDSQDYGNYVLYVIDNASGDATVARCQEYGEVNRRVEIITQAENGGIAKGNNRGICAALAAGCEYVLFLNNDTIFRADFLSGLLAEARQASARLLVPKIYYASPSEALWYAGGALRRWAGYGTVHYQAEVNDVRRRSVTYAPTCAMLVQRSVFDSIGIMDERYFVYCDDTDFCIRACDAAFSIIYTPKVSMWHKVSSLSGEGTFSIRMNTRNRVLMVKKFASSWARPYHYLMIQAYFISRMLRGGERWTQYRLRQTAFAEGLNCKM